MRILQAIQELRTGGAERVVVSLTRGARDAGHELAVVAGPGPLVGEIGVRCFPLPLLHRKPWRIPLAVTAFDRALRQFRPDVVHCHNPGIGVVAGLATVGGRRYPGLVSVHGVPEEDYAGAARALRLSRLPAVACGPGVSDALAEHALVVRDTIVNGVAPAPAPAERDALAREWGVDPHAPLVLAVGRLVEQKNHALAVRAMRELPDASLVVLGEGHLRGDLVRLAETLGVADRVRFPGARADARAAMAAADAIVLPSHWEGLPLVALEALGSGTPLVATAARGIRELVRDGDDALLVPVEDVSALAAAIRRVLVDAALASQLGDHGRELAARYSEQAMIDRFLVLYAELAR